MSVGPIRRCVMPLMLWISFMLEGPDQDDQYRMVEDEFHAVAQKFTAHLHRAEYERLKAAAKAENADTITTISRPVVGDMTDLVRKRQERRLRVQKQRMAFRRASAKDHAGDSNSEGNEAWRESALYGLMESPRKEPPRLDRLASISSTMRTRASAGFGGSQQTNQPLLTQPRPSLKAIPGLGKVKTQPEAKELEETDDGSDNSDEDLEAPACRLAASSRSASTSNTRPLSSTKMPISSRNSRAAASPTSSKQRPAPQNTAKPFPEPPTSSDESEGGFFSHLKKRRAQYKSRHPKDRKLASISNKEPSESTKEYHSRVP